LTSAGTSGRPAARIAGTPGAGVAGVRTGNAEENRVGSISTRSTWSYRLTTQTSNSAA
jgi:hypothetical protein